MLDLSESVKQIGERLFVLLEEEQQKELTDYILARKENPPVLTRNLLAISNVFTLPQYMLNALIRIKSILCQLANCTIIKRIL